jgi:hypothetical protein
MAEISPKFYEQAVRGNLFIYSTVAAGAAPVAATTTNAPCIWNPSGSGKNLILIRAIAARTADGTPVAGSLSYVTLANVGSQLGTAQPIVSGTFVAPVNALLGAGLTSVMRFAPATISTTGTPTFVANMGVFQGTNATTSVTMANFCDDIDGKIIVPPGNTIQIAASASVSSTYSFTIYALELFIPVLAQ